MCSSLVICNNNSFNNIFVSGSDLFSYFFILETLIFGIDPVRILYYFKGRTANLAENRQFPFLNTSWHFSGKSKASAKNFHNHCFFKSQQLGTKDKAIFPNVKLKRQKMPCELCIAGWRDSNYLQWTCSAVVVIYSDMSGNAIWLCQNMQLFLLLVLFLHFLPSVGFIFLLCLVL